MECEKIRKDRIIPAGVTNFFIRKLFFFLILMQH
jgi:hypothetical protein